MAESIAQDKLLNNYLDMLSEESKAYKEIHFKNKVSLLEFAKGNQWESGKKQTRIQVTVNLINTAKERMVGFLTDVRPSLKVTTRKKGLEKVATAIEMMCLHAWDEGSFSQVLDDVLDDSFDMGTSGVGVLAVKTPTGPAIEFPTVDARSLDIDPNFKKVRNRNCEYVKTSHIRSLDYIRYNYPEFGGYVQPEDEYSSFDHPEKSRVLRLVSAARQLPVVAQYFGTRKAQKGVPRAVVEDWNLIDPRINEKDEPLIYDEYGVKRVVEPGGYLYPTGRHIIRANKVILVDEATVYWDGNPIELFNWRRNRDSVWGMSEVEYLKNLQEVVNQTASSIISAILLMGNPVWIADKIAVQATEWNMFTDRVGQIIKKRQGTEVRREQGTPPPPHISEFMQQMMGMIEKVSGTDSFSQAGNILSSVAIDAYQMNALVMARRRARAMEDFVRRIFTKVIWRFFQFFSNDMLLNIFGPDERMIEYAYQREEVIRDLAAHNLDIRNAANYFKVTVEPISQLSVAKMQRAQLAVQLWTLGLLSSKRVYEILDIPHKDQLRQELIEDRKDNILPPEQLKQKVKAEQDVAKAQAKSQVAVTGAPASATQPGTGAA